LPLLNRSTVWPRFKKILSVLRPYEIVAIVFGLICAVLLQFTPLFFSVIFAFSLARRLLMFLGIVYGLAAALSIGKLGNAARRCPAGFWSGLRQPISWRETAAIVSPYASLEYLFLTIRRGASILAVIYFFLHLKHVVLFLHEANYDLMFWNLDRTIHFGWQPNVEAMKVLAANHDLAIYLDWIYFVYFNYLMLAAVLFLLEPKGRRLTECFFFAYTLLWSIGGLSYAVLPSDGPCYAVLTRYTVSPEDAWHLFDFPVVKDGIDPAYFRQYREAKIWKAKIYQQRLWHQRHDFLRSVRLPGVFYGIAAFPSLHCAAVTMVFLFLLQLSSVAAFFGGIFAVSIFVGSVFLQWHYAVDGYAGILLALLVCRLCLRWKASSSN
jgi:hypothetical protein